MPYADGAAAQTGPYEAAKVRIRPIKAYPTLWPTVQVVVIGYLSFGEHLVSRSICACECVCVYLLFGVATAELSQTQIWEIKAQTKLLR